MDRAVSPKSWWDSCGKERREKNFPPDLHSDLRNAVDAAPRAEAITHARTQTHLFNAVLSAGPPSTYRALLYVDVGPRRKKKKEPSAHAPPPTANYHEKKHSRQSPSIYFWSPRAGIVHTLVHLLLVPAALPCLPAFAAARQAELVEEQEGGELRREGGDANP